MNQQINEEAFRNGDEREFEKVVMMLNGELNYFANKITENVLEAEDIVIISFTKLFERYQNIYTLPNIRAFLYVTVRHDCLNKLKQKKTRKRHEKASAYLNKEEQGPMVLENTIEADLIQKLIKATESLPAKCREIFKLCYFEGMSIPDIALKLNKSTQNVTAQLHYGRNLLRKLVDTENPNLDKL